MPLRVLRVSSEFAAGLAAQPETGMGFQVVSAQVRFSRASEHWIVFNGELALAFDEQTDTSDWLRSRIMTPLDQLRAAATDQTSIYETPQVIASRSAYSATERRFALSRGLAPQPHALVRLAFTVSGTKYVRFSAFQVDRRVDPITGSFLPGTYATTRVDSPLSPSGFAAVGRYALPNVSPASYAHDLTSDGVAVVASGTVAPDYGQSGGGVEVFFLAGAKNTGTKSPPRLLPDE